MTTSAGKLLAQIARGGWCGRAVLLAAGVLSVLAMAPFFLAPILFLTLPLLVAGIDAASRKPVPDTVPRPGLLARLVDRGTAAAFAAGWWLGFGYHLAGLFWIGEAFLVEAETFGFLLPFAVTLMPAGLALFWGAAAAAALWFWQPGWRRVVVLAIALSIAEWLRGHVLTGFPWNLLGYALTYPLPMMQLSSVAGPYGLSLVAVMVFAWPGALWLDGWRPRDRRHGTIAAVAVAGPLAAMAAVGSLLLGLQAPPADLATAVRIVQPSVPQREKWQPQNQERIFRLHLDLSHTRADGARDGGIGKALIVWPEAAMPFLPLQSQVALDMIGEMLPPGAVLAAGGLRAELPAAAPPGSRRAIYNSLLVLGSGGRPVATYDKIHLVPFGEYLPLQSLLEAIGLQQLTKLRGGFASGVRPRPLLTIPGLPVIGPLVCYEAIFPAAIVQGRERPAVLVNVTNDGWFGNTTGPRQHLHQARVRAAEEGLPLLRAANNGISAIIDSQGRIRGRLDMNAIGVIDGNIPAAGKPTIYAAIGDWSYVALLVLALAGVAWHPRMRSAPFRRD